MLQNNTTYNKHKIHIHKIHVHKELSTMEWAQWYRTQYREQLLGLFICVCIALCTIVAHSTAQNRPDNFPFTLQTIIIAMMMSIWGKGGGFPVWAVAVSGQLRQLLQCAEEIVWKYWDSALGVWIRHLTYPSHHTTHRNHFTAVLPRWAGARREHLVFIVQGKINRGRHTDHPAGRNSIRTKQCSPPPSPYFLQAGCPSCRPTNSVKALKATSAFGLGSKR